uniref:LysM peptidoglycan-binding domain-containing protein n=1 Tax=Limosilactobacillus agrestis TaxID=2759748 RepID=UPI0035580742
MVICKRLFSGILIKDTLSRIAAKFGKTWQTLAQKNGIANPNVIYVGQTIQI